MPQQRLELTWIGKGEEPQLEPRLLIEDPDKSYGDANTDNLLIHGDNLLALKALEQEYAGKVKCVFIDPPYNTGQAFEHYDDGVEVSIWLSLMKNRLLLLSNLLRSDGVIFVQIDDNYAAHLRLILDEIFGRSLYVNTISVKTKTISGASGGGEDRRLKKNLEYILCYAKEEFSSFNPVTTKTELPKLLSKMKESGKSWKYTYVFYNKGIKKEHSVIQDGSGEDMNLFSVENYSILSVKQVAKLESLAEDDVYRKYFDSIFTTENAQTSIRTRVQDATDDLDNLYSLVYYPRSGRNKGLETEIYFLGKKKRLVNWLSNTSKKIEGKVYKTSKIGTLWNDLNWNNVTREGGVRFPNGQKPEALIQRCLKLATNPNDLVLDSFLGSGTTAAVAHKMGRRWIGIELGEHANTHCLPRLKKVVDGLDEGGITKAQNWQGGGGFKFYNLAPSLLRKDDLGQWVIDEAYNADQLAAAMAKHEGYTYAPDADRYWKQAYSTENDYLYTTTQLVTPATVDHILEQLGPEESLLICCKAYQSAAEARDPRINLHKIPASLTDRCEFGKDDYSLNIIDAPKDEDAPAFVPAGQLAAKEAEAEELRKYGKQKDMFD